MLAPRMSVADISNALGSNKFSARMSVADIPNVALGPGQVQPKGYKLTAARYGEIRLSLMKIKGNVEVEVSFLFGFFVKLFLMLILHILGY